jgi:hypothetical protein
LFFFDGCGNSKFKIQKWKSAKINHGVAAVPTRTARAKSKGQRDVRPAGLWALGGRGAAAQLRQEPRRKNFRAAAAPPIGAITKELRWRFVDRIVVERTRLHPL